MKIKFTFLFLLFVIAVQAQDKYSYMTDRKFFDPTDLAGYHFTPNKMEIPNESEQDLPAGSYSFGVTSNNLYVSGGDLKGVYSINNIDPKEYGFKLMLMNARDPTIQGHLKIILTENRHVDALVFKRSTKEKEIIFFLPEIPKRLEEKEEIFFTDRGEVEIEELDSLWGKTIYPFLRIQQSSGVQERLQVEDSTSVTFIEKITIIDKTKPKKGKKKKKKNEVEEELMVDNIEAAEEVVEEEVVEELEEELTDEDSDEEMDEEEEEVKKKIKIVKEYFVQVRSILHYNDGTVEDKIAEYPITKSDWREDEEASINAEKYQIALQTKKGEIYLYLTGKHKISTFEVEGQSYLMRGF